MITNCAIYFLPISGGANGRNQRPRGAELLFCFNVGPAS